MKSRWYPRYGADFISAIVGIGPELIGTLTVALDLIYDRGGPIPNDARWIGGILGCSTRRARGLIDCLVQEDKLMIVGHDMLSNMRAETELAIMRKRIAAQQLSGQKGGRKIHENRAEPRDKSHDIDADINNRKHLDEGSLEPARVLHDTKIESLAQSTEARGTRALTGPTRLGKTDSKLAVSAPFSSPQPSGKGITAQSDQENAIRRFQADAGKRFSGEAAAVFWAALTDEVHQEAVAAELDEPGKGIERALALIRKARAHDNPPAPTLRALG